MSTSPMTGTTGTTGTTGGLGGLANALTPATGQRTGQQSTLSEWAGPYVTQMFGKTAALADTPYQTYQGPLTAGESGLQQKFFQGLGGITFPQQMGQSFTAAGAPTIPTASLSGPQQGVEAPTGIAGQYMNPFLQNVLQPQLEEMRRQAQINQMAQAGKLTQAGAFGGSRQAIMDAELQRNLLQEMNKTIGTGYATAFDRGREQFNTEQGQARDLATLLGRAGAEQREIEQQGVLADKAEFEAQRDYPYKQLQFQQSMLQGMPIQSTAVAYQQPSSATNFLNTTGGLMSLYKQIFG